jgi:hypothetical protein
MLIHTYHAVSMQRCTMALRGRFQNGILVAWQRNGMACVNQTRQHCVNQMGKTQSKPLAERHGMCELAFSFPQHQCHCEYSPVQAGVLLTTPQQAIPQQPGTDVVVVVLTATASCTSQACAKCVRYKN